MMTPASRPLVACNVYVSAGRLQHADLLLKVLANAQVSYTFLHSLVNFSEQSMCVLMKLCTTLLMSPVARILNVGKMSVFNKSDRHNG